MSTPSRLSQGHGDRLSVVVVGGGLAGIAAAIRLADRGASVTLVETRKRLGGRATSFVDPATGQVLDNCQHVLMGCCTNLIDLYTRLGVADLVQWHDRLFFVDDRGIVDPLEADDLPAPVHMLRSLMAFRSFSWTEKIALSRGVLAMLRMGGAGRQRLHGITFARWLKDHRQPAAVIEKFWSVIVTSALNERVDRVDAAYAVQVFQDGFLANERSYVMGLPAVPLERLYDTVPAVIEQAGGTVLRSTAAQRFVFQGERLCAVRLADGREWVADAFVTALPHDRLSKLCPPELLGADDRLKSLDRFTPSPIIGVHLWFEARQGQPLMALPHLILTRSPLHWIFNKGMDTTVGGQHLHAVISAAHDLVHRPGPEIAELAVGEVRRALGESAAGAALLHARVIKEKRATFSAAPGIERLRPAARGQVANLYLAGDWCRTGWPATMEGATRSGYLAAAAVLEDHRHSQWHPVPALAADLTPHPFCRICGLQS